jgi:imidazolonepropionase-like amidohydrolase
MSKDLVGRASARLAAALLSISCAPALAASTGAIAITNARLETVTRGTIESGTLVMDGGKITAIGASVNVPAGARVIDGRGRTVTPGWIAPATNLSVAEINIVATTREDAGGTRVGAGFDVQYGINPASTTIPVARDTGVTRAVISPLVGRPDAFADEHAHDHASLQGGGEDTAAFSGLFAGQAAIIRLADGSTAPVERAKIAVAVDLGDAGAQHAGGSRGATIVLVKAALADARDFARRRGDYERGNARSYGLPRFDLEALVPVVEGRTPLLVRVSRAADIRQALTLAREEKIRIILEDAQEAWLVADEIATAGVPVLLDPQDDLPRSFELLGSRLDNAARLQRAGVTIAIKGSRNFNSLRPQRLNAGTAVAYGLTQAQALAAITINPARIWGVADRAGSLEVGKDADVVLWSGDPLETLSYPLSVIIAGVEQPDTSRRKQLQERYSKPDDGYPPAYH